MLDIFAGIRLLDGPMTDSLEAEAFNKKFDINAVYSCRWVWRYLLFCKISKNIS